MREQKLGIYSETDKLKNVGTFMQGPETALIQFYPTNASLFFDETMDVLKAQAESVSYAGLLESLGIGVIDIRGQYARRLPRPTLNKTQALSALLNKAKVAQREFGIQRPGLTDQIPILFEADCEKYGEAQAIALNRALSLDPEIPMGNVYFSRDQSNVLGADWVQSSMTKTVRKPEVSIYREVYLQTIGLPEPIQVPYGETFEGGDAYIHDRTVYIGAGSRTSLGAAMHVLSAISLKLETLGYSFAVVYDPDSLSRPEEEQMDFMHLDTFSMPLSKGKILLCEEEARRRTILTVSTNHGSQQITETDLSFLKFLEKQGQEIYPIPLQEQQYFGCNFLNLDEKTLVMPVDSNQVTNGMLKGSGKKIILADLSESTKGYGGAHCMTAQFLRSKIS